MTLTRPGASAATIGAAPKIPSKGPGPVIPDSERGRRPSAPFLDPPRDRGGEAAGSDAERLDEHVVSGSGDDEPPPALHPVVPGERDGRGVLDERPGEERRVFDA